MAVLENNQARKEHDNSWAAHTRATLVLGLPLVGAQLATSVIGVTDTLMMGWLGATALAGGALAAQVHFVVWIFGSGFAFAVMPLAANAQGADDTQGMRRAVRMGLWVVSLFFCFAIIPLWFAKDIMLALGQAPVVADIVEQYIRIAMWATLPLLWVFTLRSLLSAMEFTRMILWASIAMAILNALFNYSFMFGHFGAPAMGVRGAAVGTLLTQSIIFLAMFIYTFKKHEIREIGIFTRIWKPDWEAFSEIMRLGWPISLAILAEVSLFIGAAIMMGWIGIIPLAAHGIALQLASVAFMIPLGLSNGATVRVGKAFGRKDWLGLERAGISVITISVGFAACTAVLFWAFPKPLIGMFLDASMEDTEAVIAYAIPLVYVAAGFQLVDAAQVVATGVLRGVKDTKIPMYIAVASYWLIGMPMAYIFAFTLDLSGPGLWYGLALSLFIAAVLLNGRFILRKKYGLVPN